MADTARTFVPAAGHDWLLPLYDPLQRIFGVGSVYEQLIDRAHLRDGHHVLDVGCGTGSLAVRIARAYPEVDVMAIDPDRKALDRGQRKARRAGVDVRFEKGFADLLPFDGARFDRVFSSFMYHHLPTETKRLTLLEIRRVLRPGGRLHLVDFGESAALGESGHGLHGWLARKLHSSETLHDNVEGRIAAAMTEAGFEDVREVDHRHTIFGDVIHVRGRAPSEPR